jgi:hypothetical protein
VVALSAVLGACIGDVELEQEDEDPMAFLQCFLGFFL